MGETREHHSLSVPSSVQMFMPFEGAFVQLPLFPNEWELSCCRFSAATLSLFLPYAAVVWDSGNRYSSILFKTMSLSSCVIIELNYRIATFTSSAGFYQEPKKTGNSEGGLEIYAITSSCVQCTLSTPMICRPLQYWTLPGTRGMKTLFLTKYSGRWRGGSWGEL